jgi:pilus assembly protein Flp/PilA
MSILSKFTGDEFAAAAIEYGLIAAAIAIVTAINGIGSQLGSTFTSVGSSLK